MSDSSLTSPFAFGSSRDSKSPAPNRTRRQQRQRRLLIERLEDRRLLAFLAAPVGQPEIPMGESQRFSINAEQEIALFDAVQQIDIATDFDVPVTQARPFELNSLVREHWNVNVQDTIDLALFSQDSYLATVQTKSTDINGTTSLVAKLQDFDFAYAFIVLASDSYLVNIDIPEHGEKFVTRRLPQTGATYLVQLDSENLDLLEGGPALTSEEVPHGQLSAVEEQENPVAPFGGGAGVTFAGAAEGGLDAPVNAQVTDPASDSLGDPLNDLPNTPVQVDVLIVYTPAAKDWAQTNEGGISSTIAAAMQRANLASSNSNLGITYNLVHSAEVTYTEAGSSTDLGRLQGTTDGYMDNVHDLRNQYAADLVAMLTYTEDTGGLGYLLQNRYGAENWGFSLSRVQQTSWTYTTVHEVGHNMGAHHHKAQNVQPGPTGWTNWPENQWSAGWRWQGNDGKYYCDLMTYENGSYFADGRTHTRIPYFSSPDFSYQGQPTGNAVDGDNARTLREVKHYVAYYRDATTLQYCDAQGGNTLYGISRVQMGSIDQSAGTNPYYDFSFQSTDLTPGAGEPLTVTVHNPFAANQLLVWVDWNDDKDFVDNGEAVYVSGIGSVAEYTTTITAPVGTAAGSKRMRMRLHMPSNGGNSTPCGNNDNGEVQDFTLTVTADTTAPVVANVTSPTADGAYKAGSELPIAVIFDKPVYVIGTPQLTLETGVTDRVVNYSSGSGTDTLIFQYIVQAGDTSSDLDYVGTSALTLNGGTIRDAATNDADLTFPAPGAVGSLGDNKNLIIDTTPPSTSSFTRKTPAASPTDADALVFLATFSEDVTGVDVGDFQVQGTTTATVTNVTEVTARTYDVTVSGGDLADFNGTVGLNLKTGLTIADEAGNPLPTTEPGTDETYTLVNEDVRVYIPVDLIGAPGATVSVPVKVEVVHSAAVTIGGFDIVIEFDPTKFTVSGSELGALLTSSGGYFEGALAEPVAGKLIYTADSQSGSVPFAHGTVGDLFTLAFTVAGDAPEGASPINLMAEYGITITAMFWNNDNDLLVLPAPTNASNDTIDGVVTIDNPPTVTVDIVDAALNDTDNVSDVTFTFSEAVAGFTMGDVAVAGGTLAGFSGSGSVYTATFTATDGVETTGSVSVAVASYTDAVGNLGAAGSDTVTIDTLNPTLTIADDEPGVANIAGGDVMFTFTFSEAVTGFAADDVTVTGGTKGTFTAVSGTVYTLAVTPDANSTANITVDVGVAVGVDFNGNPNTAAAQALQAVDTTAPTLTINQATGQADPSSNKPVHFTVVFSEAMTGFLGNDISFTGSTAPGTLAAVVTETAPNDGTTYDVAVDGMTGSGTVQVSVLASVATDGGGNGNIASTSTDNEVTYSAASTIVTLSGGNLLIEDTASGGKNDTLTLSSNGTNVRVYDPNHVLQAASDAIQIDDHTVDAPLNSITGSIEVNTAEGDDTLAIDYSGTGVFFAKDIDYNGQGDSGAPGDRLFVTGGTFANVEHIFDNAHDGKIDLDQDGDATRDARITYTGLEPVTLSSTSANLTLTLSGSSDVAILEDNLDGSSNPTPTDGWSQLRTTSGTAETFVFANPAGSLSIKTGGGTDTLDVQGLGTVFDADLVIVGDVADTVRFQTNPTRVGAGDIDVTAGNIRFAKTLTTTGAARLEALAGSIIDDPAGLETDLAAATAALIADAGIDLDLQVGSVEADSGSGVLFLRNAGALVIGGVTGDLNGLVADDEITVVATGDLTVSEPIVGTTDDAYLVLDANAVLVNAVVSSLDAADIYALEVGGAGIVVNATIEVAGIWLETYSSIEFNASVLTNGGYVTARASDDITFSSSGRIDAEIDPGWRPFIELNAGRNLSMADGSAIDARVGEIQLFADGNLRVGTLRGDWMVSLFTADGWISDGTEGLGGNQATAGGFFITAGGTVDVRFDADWLGTDTAKNDSPQFLEAIGTVTLSSDDLTAGTGTITLGAGTFLTVGDPDPYTDASIFSNTQVNSGATLAGTGTVSGQATVQAGGNVAPGASPGRLAVDNSITFTGGATPSRLAVEINGSAASTHYDQLTITGAGRTVALNSAALDVTVDVGYVPSIGTSFTIIDVVDSSSAVSGAFAGLGDDRLFLAGTTLFRIDYNGGTGNDVTLTVAPLDPPTALDLAAEDDTGSDGTDNVTKNTTDLTISGLAEIGVTVELFADTNNDGVVDSGESLGTTTVAGGSFTKDVSLAAGTHQVKAIQTDVAGHVSAASAALNITIDTTPPAVTVNSLMTNEATPAITGTVSDGALAVVVNSKTYTAGDGNLTVNGTDWTLQIPAGDALGEGTYPVTASSTDLAGNTGTDGTTNELIVDTTPPSLTITDDEPGVANIAGGDVTFTFTFSEAVTGFVAADITVTGGTKGAFTAVSGTVYTLAVSPDAESTADVTVDVAAGVAVDAHGNPNTAAVQVVQAVDTLDPAVAGLAPADDSVGAPRDTDLTITFNEPIRKGAGTIVVRKSADGSAVESIDVADAAVAVADSTATITLAGLLPGSTGFYVEVGAGAFEDLAGNDFAGISGVAAWNFRTNFVVVSLTPTSSGFHVRFSQDLDASVLNLYDEGGTLGPADLTLIGAAVGKVRGSFVIDPGLREATFITTNGLLPQDQYTVTLSSGATAFRDSGGSLLDGDGDGTPGGDFVDGVDGLGSRGQRRSGPACPT
jgi:hypothetical protein